MKIKEFLYTKPNGETSHRTLVELVAPTEHFEGIDVSALDMDSYGQFVVELNQLESEIYQKRSELYNKFDLNHNYRRFVPSRMTQVTTEHA